MLLATSVLIRSDIVVVEISLMFSVDSDVGKQHSDSSTYKANPNIRITTIRIEQQQIIAMHFFVFEQQLMCVLEIFKQNLFQHYNLF